MPVFGQDRATGKGPYSFRWATWPASVAIQVGDLTYQSTVNFQAVTGRPYCYSASQFPWQGSLSATQIAFKGQFLGVSATRRTAVQNIDGDQVSDGGVWGSGEFMFPCAALAAVAVPGSYWTISQGAGNTLNPALIQVTTNVSQALGRVTRAGIIGDTFLTINLWTVIEASGVQAQA